MKGVKQNLPPGRKASNARMQKACTNLTKHIMGDTTAARWLKRNYLPEKREYEIEEPKVGWFGSFFKKLFGRV